MVWVPVLVREADRGGRPCLRLGHRRVDRYLDFRVGAEGGVDGSGVRGVEGPDHRVAVVVEGSALPRSSTTR